MIFGGDGMEVFICSSVLVILYFFGLAAPKAVDTLYKAITKRLDGGQWKQW